MKRISLLLIVILCGMVACRHKDVNPVSPSTGTGGTGGTGGNGGGTGGGGTSPDTALCFERDVLPIFIANCARSGCHDAVSAQDGYVFTSHQTITGRKFKPWDPDETELWEKINENKPQDIMPPPPNPALTAQQKGIIKEWILRGAPNTGGCTTGCDSMKFTFAATILPLTQQYCRGCHSSAAPSNGIALDNYAGVQAVALNGKLLGALRHMTGFSPMPKGGAQLSDCQIRQVEKWIAAGALNN